MQGLQQAVNCYQEALKLDPKNDNTRYNLAYARRLLLQQQQQQQQQGGQNQQQNQDNQHQNHVQHHLSTHFDLLRATKGQTWHSCF